ncbi:MAG: hypothetical protein HQL18_02640 [Candidatus Omnitrophica bacterium]|nr:hypothetical protein [Candidatus Omnitrophota bacterium]
MKKFLIAVLAVLGFSCLVSLTPVRAQENVEDKFSFGKVVSVADQQITVKEYDFTKDADVETTYSLTPETELGNINAVKDLAVGDDIVLDYAEKDGKRIVTTLVKEEKGGETVPAAEDQAAAPAPADVAKAAPASGQAAPAPTTEDAAKAAPTAETAPAETGGAAPAADTTAK